MRSPLAFLVHLAILAYPAYYCQNLLASWFDSPYARYGWLALILFVLPILYFIGAKRYTPLASPMLAFLSLLFTLFGVMSSFNVLKQTGLLLALASIFPFTPTLLPWMISGSSWMTASGYFGAYFSIETTTILRLGISIAGSLYLLFVLFRNPGKLKS